MDLAQVGMLLGFAELGFALGGDLGAEIFIRGGWGNWQSLRWPLRSHRVPSDLEVLGCVSAIYSHGVDPIQHKRSVLQFIGNLWLLYTKNE